MPHADNTKSSEHCSKPLKHWRLWYNHRLLSDWQHLYCYYSPPLQLSPWLWYCLGRSYWDILPFHGNSTTTVSLRRMHLQRRRCNWILLGPVWCTLCLHVCNTTVVPPRMPGWVNGNHRVQPVQPPSHHGSIRPPLRCLGPGKLDIAGPRWEPHRMPWGWARSGFTPEDCHVHTNYPETSGMLLACNV